MTKCLIALGSNLGDRSATLDAAIDALSAADGVAVKARSSWQLTIPVGVSSEAAQFLNGAAILKTSFDAHQLLALLQQVESRFGRERHVRWGDRTLDLDLLLFGDEVIDSPKLTVPHPRMSFRRFVLEPAVEIAGDMLHPTIGWPLERLLDHLESGADAVAIVSDNVEKRRGIIALLKDRFGLSERSAPANAPQEDWLAIPGAETSHGSPKLSILIDTPIDSLRDRGPALVVPAADGQSVEADVFAAIEAVWPRLGPLGG
jgi:2-amino-4-hydroxy-6-hydroxymethyldihydropteridine diphosphokinase